MLPLATRAALLALYDAPDSAHTGRVLVGYDRDHAERTTRIVLLVARELGLDSSWEHDLEVACLLHDIGRAGIDPALFGKVFTVAAQRGLPVRITELLARYPQISEEGAPAFFWEMAAPAWKQAGIPLDDRLREHIRMRMDFKGRMRDVVAVHASELRSLGITIHPWMEQVILYYYYPHLMDGERDEVRLMGMVLVACENFEAFNNSRRGRDYYGRKQERLQDVFTSLQRFDDEGLVSRDVMAALRRVTVAGKLDGIIRQSRGMSPEEPLPPEDREYVNVLRAILQAGMS